MGRINNNLKGKDAFALQLHVRDRYADSGLNDSEFAREATQALGFTVTSNNVAHARGVFNLPNNQPAVWALNAARRAQEAAPDTAQLAEAQRQVTELQEQLKRLREDVEDMRLEFKGLIAVLTVQNRFLPVALNKKVNQLKGLE